MSHKRVLIIGAGPAGLACAHELISRCGDKYLIDVFEAEGQVGGISKTVKFDDYYFDLGGHRFHSEIKEVNKLWQKTLGADFLSRKRISRIYYRNMFFNYPLQIKNVLWQLGLLESFLVIISYIKRKVLPVKKVVSFEDWVINKFGDRLYNLFFREYTKKVWGVEGNKISTEWAKQRIGRLSLWRAILNTVGFNRNDKTLISVFKYPKYGPGMMYEKIGENIKKNKTTNIHLHTKAISIKREEEEWRVEYQNGEELGTSIYDEVVSTMPINYLITALDNVPREIIEISAKLEFRDFLIVCFVFKEACSLKDNWLYIHDKNVGMGRVQIFNNWSEHMLKDKKHFSLGCEYFCSKGDRIWDMSDDGLIELSKKDLVSLKIIKSGADILLARVIRVKNAYPVYNDWYVENFEKIKNYLDGLSLLQTVGRGAMFQYNNMDHSVYAGILAARNIVDGQKNDLWKTLR